MKTWFPSTYKLFPEILPHKRKKNTIVNWGQRFKKTEQSEGGKIYYWGKARGHYCEIYSPINVLIFNRKLKNAVVSPHYILSTELQSCSSEFKLKPFQASPSFLGFKESKVKDEKERKIKEKRKKKERITERNREK